MDLILTVILIVTTLTFFALLYALIYNRFQIYIIKINEVEGNIDNSLRDKYDTLAKSIKIIKNHINSKEEVLEGLSDLKEAKISNFDLDRKLAAFENDFFQYKENYPDLDNIKNFNRVCNDLKEIDQKLAAYKSYYNDNITKFNKLIRIFPSNIVGKLSRFSEKHFYDGKNMSDDDIEDFKL